MKCLFCFGEGGRIHFDRKSRPYYFCALCSARVFVRNEIGLKAIMAWVETAKALTQEQFLALLQKIESSAIFQHRDIQKWVNAERSVGDVVAKSESEK